MFAASKTAAVSSAANYIEDVFSTYLYTGNSSTQTITNGIDLYTNGGLVWIKNRDNANTNNNVYDTNRGIYKYLQTNTTDPQTTDVNRVTAFNSNGFSIGAGGGDINRSPDLYVSWTFRKQPKFFQCLTYTGNGTSQTISHNLGSTPGCIITKRTNAGSNWLVYHRSIPTQNIYLNKTDAAAGTMGITSVGSTTYDINGSSELNENGGTYVAYIYAHNAGGFGLTGADNVISCGTFDANLGEVINLGYEPQWLLYRDSSSVNNWRLADNMRGLTNLSGTNAQTIQQLTPNTNAAEAANSGPVLTSSGFTWNQSGGGNKHIYIAIRRGPMKVPTSGTSVYGAETWAGNGASPRTFTSSNWTFPADLVTVKSTDSAAWWNQWSPRLTGGTLSTNDTGAEQTPSTSIAGYVSSFNQTGYTATSGSSSISNYNNGSSSYVSYNIRRAPSFMDVVCYTGTGSQQNITHNLGVAPELMIVKRRSAAGGSWATWATSLTADQSLALNTTDDKTAVFSVGFWGSTYPTSSVFTVGSNVNTNSNTVTYVAYLFATCAGVSKVGSYTGTGALQTVNCGFTGGARFVMIKRTDSTGGWFYYDSVRGITSGNDPYLFFNVSDAQVTSTNFVDTDSTGFKVTAAAPAELNANGGTYIFLAIA